MKILSSEWLRTKRTAIRWLTFCMPIVFASLVIGYMALRKDVTEAFIYEAFFTVWTGLIIPLGVGCLAGFIVHEEELAGNFSGFLSSGLPRSHVYMGKFIIIVFCTMICTLIAAIILSGGMYLLMPAAENMTVFIAAAFLASFGTLPIIAIHLWISFAWGMGASIGISFGGLLMAVLFGATSLGDKVWFLVPWTWPVKLGLLPGYTLINSSAQIIRDLSHTLLINVSLTIIGLCVFLIGGIFWFRKWEGRKTAE